MDWNWFFSSFCQSAAALLGIIGAFVISRLIGVNEKIAELVDYFDKLKLGHERIKSQFEIRRFRWYNNMLWKFNGKEVREDIENGMFENLSKTDALEKFYERNKSYYAIDDFIYQKITSHKKRQNTPGFGFDVSALEIPPAGLWQSMDEEKEKINQLTIEAKLIIREFGLNERSCNVFIKSLEPVRVIVILLCIAFPLTVIYPLHFMPMNGNSVIHLTLSLSFFFGLLFTVKGIMLLIFFVVIELIFFYFLYLIKKLVGSLNNLKMNNLAEYRQLSHYSEFIRV